VKKIAVLGSTGSIGRQTLQVVSEHPHLQITALAAGGNWRLLAEQAFLVGAAMVTIADSEAVDSLRAAVPDGVEVLTGPDAMAEMVSRCDADIVLSGVVGSCGLRAALAAIERGMDLALANKETLVVAGHLVTQAAAAKGIKLLPVDSEHSAIHQCLAGSDGSDIRRVIITASGGPLRTWAAEQIAGATIAEALNHPTWEMGPKISIDSATLMNKALEIIEAHWLFGLTGDQIDVVIHPESIVHSIVEFRDGSQLAQLGWPDMTTPIAYALNYPCRLDRDTRRLDLAEAGSLTFESVGPERSAAIDLAFRVLDLGHGAGAVLNGANEAAVQAFLQREIRFGDIVPLVRETLNKHTGTDETDLEAVLAADRWARGQVAEAVAGARSSRGHGHDDTP
jgi:1-deoxy-D-xylulose-5-phosphate reductoisomerase